MSIVTQRNGTIAVCFVGVLATLGVAQGALEKAAASQGKAAVQAPYFEVDPVWPKPTQKHWLYGNVIGVSVDNKDRVYIVHRGAESLDTKEIYASQKPPMSECCVAAPPIVVFDGKTGDLVTSWGGPGQGYEWPESNHGITADSKGNVYIGGSGEHDGQILKFTQDGKFIKQFGFAYANAGSNDPWAFNQVAKISLDEKANEGFVSDGYGNKRVAVIDLDTGKIKRYWGAYGEKPDDKDTGRYLPEAAPIRQFRNPVHCAEPSNDGFVYVCDRVNDRIQVFQKDGKFVKEQRIKPKTLGDGSVWDIAFSKDPQQRYIYLADGSNEKVYVMDRQSLEILTSFGDGGRQPGGFYAVHSIAADSQGNLYTTETYEGKRVQKFVYKGLRPVTKADQGIVFPTGR
jgi:DNA-binding beta-propeller fold protein YncE